MLSAQFILILQEIRTSTLGVPDTATNRTVSRLRARVDMIEIVQDRNEEFDEAIVLAQFTVNAVQVNLLYKQTYLLRKPGTINGTTITIQLDCGASINVIHPRLPSRIISTQRGQLKRFDGSLSLPAELATVEATVHTSKCEFLNMTFTATHLDADQD